MCKSEIGFPIEGPQPGQQRRRARFADHRDCKLDELGVELAIPVIGEASAARLLARLWSLEGEAGLAFTQTLR